MFKKFRLEQLGVLFFAGAIGCYFFQVPFSGLSSFIVPFLFLFLLTQVKNIRFPKKKFYMISFSLYEVFLVTLAICSLVSGIGFARVLRFFVILTSLPVFCFIKDAKFSTKRNLFIWFAVVKSILLITIAVAMVIYGDFRIFRSFAYTHGYGDIYILHGIPYVQVHGNALLLIAFMLDFYRKGKFTWKNVVILLGILTAGNFAFILGLAAFILWQGTLKGIQFIKKRKNGKYILIVLLLVLLIAISPYMVLKFREKVEKSNVVRIEQAKILLDANPLVGEGLGNPIVAQTTHVNYDGPLYFELQTLYIYNQVGIVGLGLFYFLTLFSVGYRNKSLLVLYLIYLFYSFWNPYCFDSTHMITLFLILNVKRVGEVNERRAYYRLLSFRKRL